MNLDFAKYARCSDSVLKLLERRCRRAAQPQQIPDSCPPAHTVLCCQSSPGPRSSAKHGKRDKREVRQAEGAYPYAWNYGLIDVREQFSIPTVVNGSEENVLQPQASWDQTGRTNPPLPHGAVTMASPMSPVGTMPPDIRSYGPLNRPPPPQTGQTPSSPSQSSLCSYSSPSSGVGSHCSKNNSFSSLAALRPNAIEPMQLDAHFGPVPEQGPSPVESPQSRRKMEAQGSNKSKKSSSAIQKTESRRRSMINSAAYYNQDALPPAATLSPGDDTIVAPDSPAESKGSGPVQR